MNQFPSEMDKEDAINRLSLFFRNAIEIGDGASLRELGWGNPCSNLKKQVGLSGGVRGLATKLLEEQGSEGEFPLNHTGGLKLFWRWDHSLVLSVGGNQSLSYPETRTKLMMLIAHNSWGYFRP